MMMRMSVPMPMYIWRISFSSGTGPSYPGGRVPSRQCGATTPPSGAMGRSSAAHRSIPPAIELAR